MGVGNRLLLALYALVTLVLAVALAVALIPVLPERTWLNETRYLTGRPEVLAALVVYFLVSVHFFLCSFSTQRERRTAEICLSTEASGRVQVAVAAAQSVTERAARAVQGVRDVVAKISVPRTSKDAERELRVRLRLSVRSGTPIRETADEVSDRVRQELARVLGTENVQVEISVAEISDERLPQRPRVS